MGDCRHEELVAVHAVCDSASGSRKLVLCNHRTYRVYQKPADRAGGGGFYGRVRTGTNFLQGDCPADKAFLCHSGDFLLPLEL